MANYIEIIQELKQSFLVKDQGLSLEEAADCYDEMDDDTRYQDALKEAAE